MKKSWSLAFLVLTLAINIGSLAQTISLPRGTHVRLTMPYPVSISAEIGEQVRWKVADDVIMGGVTVIAKGANALATVDSIFAEGNQPRLTLQMESVELISGASAPLCVQQNGYRLLHFYTTPGNAAVVPEGEKITVLVASSVLVGAGRKTGEQAPQSPSQISVATNGGPAFTLADGTPVRLKFARDVSSDTVQVGDRVAFVVAESVKAGSIPAIADGSTAWGTVTEARTAGGFGRRGRLAITLDNVQLITGEQAALRADKVAQGQGKAAETWGPLVLSVVGGLIIAATVEGNDILIPKGKDITAYVNGDVRFGVVQTVTATVPANPPSLSLADNVSTVNIQSTPVGADILVDGRFVGSTPTRILMAGGQHEIRITKRGFRSWSRRLSVSGGNVQVSARLAGINPSTAKKH